MVGARVRVPARAHRRTNYCSHADQHDSHVVSQRAGQQNKFTAWNGDQPEAMDVKKYALNLVKIPRDMRKNKPSSEEPKFDTRPAPNPASPAYLSSPATISV